MDVGEQVERAIAQNQRIAAERARALGDQAEYFVPIDPADATVCEACE